MTSTSLQFGASAYLEAGASWGGIRGNIAFNCIVMSEPSWYFEFDLSFRVTAYLFGCDLISAGLRGVISGPDPWHLDATIYWEVCGVDISKDLGPYEWGDDDALSSVQEEARLILGDGLEDPGNWSLRRAGQPRVQLRAGSDGAIDSRDQIEVRQSRLPLGTALEVHDRNRLSDGGTWTLTPISAGLVKLADVTDVFPMRRYRAKPPKETPFQDGLAAGARFGGAGLGCTQRAGHRQRRRRHRRSGAGQPAGAAAARADSGAHRADRRAGYRSTHARGRSQVDAPRHRAGAGAVKLWFLPFVREGIVPTTAAGARAQAQVAMRLAAPGRTARDITRQVDLLGPGDVIGIEPGQILRMTPSPAARDAEPDFFPLVEFDAPDLPWAYSPALPDGSRWVPWIALVVIEAQPGVRVDPGERGQSHWILRMPPDVARRELPDLADAATWAHAQVACASAAEIAATLANAPDRTLGRLLAPRRLAPNREYLACVVPTFLTGRVAGLGGDPASDPAVRTGREPAWSATDIPAELPVYHTWRFRTGAAGDFEALAQRLRPTPLDASIPPPALNLATPAGLVVDWEPPLRVPGSKGQRPPRPAAAVAEIRKALKGGTVTAPVLGPSYFGSSWLDERSLSPLTAWAPELNLTPMWRAAAGLGAEAVRGEQEALVAAAQEQFDAQRAAQREGRRKQLATTVVNRVKLRLAQAPASESQRVFAPLFARTQPAAASVGLFSVAGRRMARKTWRSGAVSPFAGAAATIGTIASTGAATRRLMPMTGAPAASIMADGTIPTTADPHHRHDPHDRDPADYRDEPTCGHDHARRYHCAAHRADSRDGLSTGGGLRPGRGGPASHGAGEYHGDPARGLRASSRAADERTAGPAVSRTDAARARRRAR